MMLLQIYFDISEGQANEFEEMFRNEYIPALKKQTGYIRSTLLQIFPRETAIEIEASPTDFNYQIELIFDTEENRRRWVASDEHDVVWPKAEFYSRKVAWRGYNLVATG